MKKREKNPVSLVARWLSIFCIALCVGYLFFTALSNLNRGQGEEGRRQLEDSLRRASVACYATEGIYPPDLAYLEQHYGLQINRKEYTVFYEIFANNLMPDITVLEVTP